MLRGRFGFSFDPLRRVVAVRLVFKWSFSRSLHDGIEVKAKALENVSFISGLFLDPRRGHSPVELRLARLSHYFDFTKA